MSEVVGNIHGNILEIQRFSIHDGPGIRTTVFLKGCPLSCHWCHNPESQSPKPVLSFIASKCIGCGYCLDACPAHAHKLVDGQHVIDRLLCTSCGKCTEKCYAKALEIVGQEMTTQEALDVVMSDKPFYDNSGGGLTISGGEPAMQPVFTTELLKLAKENSLHTAIETCGQTKWNFFEKILPLTDLFLFDWKESDPQKHKECCGLDNILIRENLEKLSDSGAEIILRCPIIPGLNDRDDHFKTIAELYKTLNISAVEIMPYHRLGESKYDRFGLTENDFTANTPDPKDINSWLKKLTDFGAKNILNEQE